MLKNFINASGSLLVKIRTLLFQQGSVFSTMITRSSGRFNGKCVGCCKEQGKQIAPDLPPLKNKISFMGEVFNWEEFNKIEELENILERMVIEYKNRSLLQKVKRSTLGFEKILRDSTKGSFRNIKFWRLAYYLREIHHDARKAKGQGKPKTDYAELIIEAYRKIVIHNIFHAKEKEQIQNYDYPGCGKMG